MAQAAKYLYCIIPCREERTFDVAAIGDGPNLVHTVSYEDLAAVASDSLATSYEGTRNNMMAHEKALERVMQDYTLLPIRFGTVANDASPTENIRKLLRGRFREFSQLLRDMEGRAELGLKALWRDEEAIFAEILEENPGIRRLRDRLSRKPPQVARFEGVALGRMVREALEHKRSQEASRVLAPLRPLAERVRENACLVDRMVFNAAFLIDKSREPEFDQTVNRLDAECGGRISFKYIGPTPPYNFVNIVVNWDELEE